MITPGFSKLSIILAGVGLALLVFVPSYYFYSKYKTTQKLLADPKYLQKQETSTLVKLVGKLIDLPEGEEPTIATVSDKDKLKPQPFFAKAENGDKVLIYTKAKKAYLYRPSTNKVIEVGPVTIGETQTTPQDSATRSSAMDLPTTLSPTQKATTPTPAKTLKVAIYNASQKPGIAAQARDIISKELPELEVVEVGNAKGDYAKSQIVDLTGGSTTVVNRLKILFSAESFASLPSGEASASADLVLLLAE